LWFAQADLFINFFSISCCTFYFARGACAGSRYNFSEMEKHAAILATVTKADVLDWFTLHLHPDTPTRRKLTVMLVGNADTTEVTSDTATVYTSAADFVAQTVSLEPYFDSLAHVSM
jgi:secreted Zn-dependent insulinase-like peptidase